jgi:hypothetical protein
MEHLWSQAGATSGNRWQMQRPRKWLKQVDRQPVATHRNGFGAHGKEGVDGSSPSEGLRRSRMIPRRQRGERSVCAMHMERRKQSGTRRPLSS